MPQSHLIIGLLVVFVLITRNLVLDQIPLPERNSFCLATLLSDVICTDRSIYKEQIVSTFIETVQTYSKACRSNSLSNGKSWKCYGRCRSENQ